MAICEARLPDDIYEAISKLASNTEEVLENTLKAGGKVVLAVTKSNLNRSVTNSSKRSTGQLMGTLGLSKVGVDHEGVHNVKVGFAEPRREQPKGGKYSRYEKTNAMVANILEHGKKDQSARPFVRPAIVTSKKPAIDAMKSTFDAELQRLGVK